MSRHESFRLLVLSCAFLAACGGQSSNPVGPSSGVTPPAVATPSPTPVPTPYVPPAPGTAVCSETAPVFRNIVSDAIEQTRIDRPDIFDYEQLEGWIIVTRPGRYVQTVVDNINARPPFKAVRHWYAPDTLISVKNDDGFSETYGILTSFYGVTRDYAETCRPAEF